VLAPSNSSINDASLSAVLAAFVASAAGASGQLPSDLTPSVHIGAPVPSGAVVAAPNSLEASGNSSSASQMPLLIGASVGALCVVLLVVFLVLLVSRSRVCKKRAHATAFLSSSSRTPYEAKQHVVMAHNPLLAKPHASSVAPPLRIVMLRSEEAGDGNSTSAAVGGASVATAAAASASSTASHVNLGFSRGSSVRSITGGKPRQAGAARCVFFVCGCMASHLKSICPPSPSPNLTPTCVPFNMINHPRPMTSARLCYHPGCLRETLL
jgi:hypothetical protein